MLRSGLRQLLLGALAIAVTYGVGHLIGSDEDLKQGSQALAKIHRIG